MTDDRQVYSDEEFALILSKAAELAEPADPRSHSQGGLTLAEMKAAAAQAGFDPALVERAARLLRANATAAPSFMERLIGGRARHRSEARFRSFWTRREPPGSYRPSESLSADLATVTRAPRA